MLAGLTLQNLRCFEEMRLALSTPGPRGGEGWTILVGQNGTGKSTILQSIVLAALDPRPVTSLVPDAWTFVRNVADADPLHAHIRLAAENGAAATRRISGHDNAYVEGDTSDLGLPLVLGFSARRRIAHPGELPVSENLEVERVRGLFATDHPLLTQDPFGAFDAGATARDFAKVVRDVVTYSLSDDPNARLFPLVDTLELRGNGGITKNKQMMEQRRFVLRYGGEYVVRVGIEDLSDGYQAMLAIVLEILYQAALARRAVPDPTTLEAVILIDEIEAHLHPRWQRTVVPLLREIFPRCQFVVTTHSPLVVGSARRGEVIVLDIGDDGAVGADVLDERLGMLGAERIYEEVFGVQRSASPELVRAEREYLDQIAKGTPGDADLHDLVDAAWEDAHRRSQS
jgi:predicted ATPase